MAITRMNFQHATLEINGTKIPVEGVEIDFEYQGSEWPDVNVKLADPFTFELRFKMKLKFTGIRFKYNAPGDGCIDDAYPRPWLFQHRLKFGWQEEQDGTYLFCGLFYLAWNWRQVK